MKPAAALFLLALSVAAQQPVTTPIPDVAAGLEHGREKLARYQWRLRTELKIDGVSRLTKVEDVHLGPDGGLVLKKTVRFDRRPAPTPYPENDPRFRAYQPPTEADDDRYVEAAMDLMQLYARLSPEHLRRWAEGARLQSEDPDRPGRVKLVGRGLGRPQDEAALYLDAKTREATEIEVKTTVHPDIKDIAFIRVTFEALADPAPASKGMRVPKRIFLNMTLRARQVSLDMETADWRSWP